MQAFKHLRNVRFNAIHSQDDWHNGGWNNGGDDHKVGRKGGGKARILDGCQGVEGDGTHTQPVVMMSMYEGGQRWRHEGAVRVHAVGKVQCMEAWKGRGLQVGACCAGVAQQKGQWCERWQAAQTGRPRGGSNVREAGAGGCKLCLQVGQLWRANALGSAHIPTLLPPPPHTHDAQEWNPWGEKVANKMMHNAVNGKWGK